MRTCGDTGFGARLKAARRAKGLTLAVLSRAVGCKLNTLWRYEAGRRDPPLSTAVKLAAALGVRLDSLL